MRLRRHENHDAIWSTQLTTWSDHAVIHAPRAAQDADAQAQAQQVLAGEQPAAAAHPTAA